jgi:dipeptidyl aminopeptidase/acylaminoacyl peptidase
MAAKPIDSDFIFDLPAVSEPAIRPDGQAVAFVYGHVDREAMEGRSHLEIVPFGGGESQRLTAGLADRKPVWSPDGSTLAFLRAEPDEERGGERKPAQLWLLPSEGGEARRLTELPAGVLGMTWAPDGASLICVSDVDPHGAPQTAGAGGGTPRAREVRRVYYRADTIGWRGDVRRQLFRVDVSGGEARQITRGDYDHALPVFSPDGETLAFVSSDRSATRHRKQRGGELCLMPAGGGRVRALVRRMDIGQLAWSPNGAEIAFVGSEIAEPRSRAEERHPQPYLHVVDVESGERRRLHDDSISPQGGFFPIIDPPALTWAGRRLLFTADARAASGVYSVTPSGRGLRRERDARGVIAGLSTTADGSRCAMLTTAAGRPPELTALELRNGRSRRLTAVSAAYIDGHPPAKVERFSVRRAGFDVDCWLMFPPGFEADRRYPLVLEVHGGPNGAFMSGFNPLHQIIAGAGNIVLFTNPRGSTTYGVDFASRVYEDWGGEDYLDLMAATDAACRRPYVDERRLGVHGYSYGGFMASWIVGHTDRFRAAVVGAPVIDLVSMYGTTDIGVTFGEAQWGGRPTRNLDWYIERSPIRYADRVQTPVLLLHGEADIRCPIAQSEEYYVALKRQGKTVEFVRFPECSHLFLRGGHPAMRKEYYDRVVGWFKRWL